LSLSKDYRIFREFHNIIAVPGQNQDAPIALTAWQHIELLNEYDEPRITAFIDVWRGRAPENVP
jgi:hypothetical protein